MAATEQKAPDYVVPADQGAVLHELEVHRRLLEVVGAGRLYQEDALGRVRRAFAQAAENKRARMFEVRAKAAQGREVTGGDVDGLDPDELFAVIAGPPPRGYTEVLVSRKQDDAERQRIRDRIHKRQLRELEEAEERRRLQARMAELGVGNGKPTKAKEAKTDATS